jgi:hypothetical protein
MAISHIHNGTQVIPIGQTPTLREVAEKVANALRDDSEPLEIQVGRFLQQFDDFARRGIQPPREEVDKIDEAFLHMDVPEDIRELYRTLCGYTRPIVDLRKHVS